MTCINLGRTKYDWVTEGLGCTVARHCVSSQLFWVTTMQCNYESETIRANSECHHGSSLPQQSPFQSSPQAAPRHGFLSHSQSSQRFYHHGKWPAEVPPLGGAAAPPHLDFPHPVLASLFDFAAITFFFLATLTVQKKRRKKPTCEIFDRYCPANLNILDQSHFIQLLCWLVLMICVVLCWLPARCHITAQSFCCEIKIGCKTRRQFLSSLFLVFFFCWTYILHSLDSLREDKIRIPKCNKWPAAFSTAANGCLFPLQASTKRLSKKTELEVWWRTWIRFALSKPRVCVCVGGGIICVPYWQCLFNGRVSGRKRQQKNADV